MIDPLDSARFSVEHANEHIAEIKHLVQAFLRSDPHTVSNEPDPNYSTHYLQYVILTKPLPRRITGLAWDATNNLRSALDQLGYAVAIANDRTSGHDAHFPFSRKPEDYGTEAAKRSRDIPKEIFELMTSFEPYKGGNDALWRLNKIANTNKHEVVVRALPLTTELVYQGANTVLTKRVDGDGTEDKILIGWLRRDMPQPYHQLKLNTTVRFSDIRNIPFPRPAIELLDDFSRVVECIISTVEAEARRLGILK